jgi:hypothetical protein
MFSMRKVCEQFQLVEVAMRQGEEVKHQLRNPVLYPAELRGLLSNFSRLVVSGRLAYLAGRIPRKMYATASSPLGGVIGR